MPRRLLIVVTTEVADGALRDLVRTRAGDDAEMLVVAPASEISRLDWLTNAEDDARAEASSLVTKTAEATTTANVEASASRQNPYGSMRKSTVVSGVATATEPYSGQRPLNVSTS